MMHADAAHQQLLELRPGALATSRTAPVRRRAASAGRRSSTRLPLSCSATVQHSSRLKQKTRAGVVRASSSPCGHLLELLGQQHVADPVVLQRHLALVAGDQFQPPVVARAAASAGTRRRCPPWPTAAACGRAPAAAPATVPRRCRAPGSVKLWNSSITTALTSLKSNAAAEGDSPRCAKHPSGRSGKSATVPFSAAVQQAVQQDFGHDDQHAGVGILAAVAGHQAHVARAGSPTSRPPLCISRNFCSVRAISGVV